MATSDSPFGSQVRSSDSMPISRPAGSQFLPSRRVPSGSAGSVPAGRGRGYRRRPVTGELDLLFGLRHTFLLWCGLEGTGPASGPLGGCYHIRPEALGHSREPFEVNARSVSSKR